jgi:two-component SAPR family response regulator
MPVAKQRCNITLAGSVLVVEDECFIADDIDITLSDAGARIVGPLPTADEALRVLAHEHVDAAVLDIALGRHTVYPVAHELRRRAIPFLFLSGYIQEFVHSEFRREMHLVKPYTNESLVRAVGRLLGQSAPHQTKASSKASSFEEAARQKNCPAKSAHPLRQQRNEDAEKWGAQASRGKG